MKIIDKISISFAVCILSLISGVGIANAQQVTVNYQVLPDGPILSNNNVTSCTPETADTYTGYKFVFWDNQGTISWNSSLTVCPGSGIRSPPPGTRPPGTAPAPRPAVS